RLYRFNCLILATFLGFVCFGMSAYHAEAQNSVAQPSAAASASTNAEPPLSWIDPDTGHRIIRLTREPGSDSFYFNYNCFTPDGKKMAYTTPKGISVLNLQTMA